MKKTLLIVLSLVFVLVSCNEKGASTKTVKSLKSEDDKTLYAMGFMLGGNLARLKLTDAELSSLYVGVKDSALGNKAGVDMGSYQPKIQALFKKKMEVVSKAQKEGGKKFFENFLKEEGVKKTASGLAYKIVKEGTGKMPKADETVEVHYHGTLTDGTVFDSSVDRGKTVSFPLNRVIKGWTEGLQLVKEGGKIKLVIPSELGYGENGAPPKIPGGATLVFDVELVKIGKAEAKKAPAKPAAKKK